MNRSFVFPVLAALTCAVASAQGQLVSRGQVVLASGDPVAAVAGATIDPTNGSAVETGAMDLNGNLLFRGLMTGGGVLPADNRAYFLGRGNGDLRMIVRSGQADPSGTMPGVFLTTGTATGLGSSPRLSPEGLILMYGATLSGQGVVTTGGVAGGQNNSALYWGTPGAQLVLCRYGDLAPSGGSQIGTLFSGISGQSTALNAQGKACFKVTLVGGDVVGVTNNEAWLYGMPGNLQFLQRKGDLELGGSVGIGSLGFNCMMNEVGQVLHDETLSTALGSTPATTANNNIVFVWTPGSGNAVFMRKGDQAAGCAPGVLYGSPTMGQAFSKTGVGSFGTTMTGAVTTGVDDVALFVGRAGSLQLAVRRGDPAPGTGGLIFSAPNFNHASNDSGALCFFAVLAGAGVTTANDSSIWTGTPGNLQMIAREGDPAPGITGGVFEQVVAGSCMINGRGHVLFNARVLVGTTSTPVYYSWDAVHGLQLQLAVGDQVTTALGQQTVQSFGGVQFPSGDSGPQSLNSNGDFFVKSNFTAGAGIIRGHVGALVAKPSSLSATTGGTQTMHLDAGSANAGSLYLVAGTTSGTRPGFPLGGHNVPLNLDAWLNLSCTAANSSVYGNTMGLLDGQGRATATFNFPPNFASFAGTNFHHAFGVINGSGNVSLVSEPAALLMY